MSRARELLRAREARWARADHGDGMPRQPRRRLGHDPTLVPAAVHDRELDLLDRHRLALANLEHACGLAWRGAEAAREVGEVVRAVELLDRLLPAVTVDQVVPVRDQVVDRAAVVAERN